MDKPLNSLDCYTGVKGSIPFLPLLLTFKTKQFKNNNNMERFTSFIVLLSIFATGYFFGYRSGLKTAWNKVIKYLRYKRKMSDNKAAKVFMEIINTK